MIGWEGLEQPVEAGSPPGLYTVSVYAGIYPDSIWGQDSFYFEKLEYDAVIATSGKIMSGSTDPVLTLHPNPFNNSTTIEYHVQNPASVFIELYDINGRLTESISRGNNLPGCYSVNLSADKLSSGVYFIKASIGEQLYVLKILLVK